MKKPEGPRRSPGAGRPSGTGKFGEPTRVLRVPESTVPALVSYLNEYRLARLAAKLPAQRVAQTPPEVSLRSVRVKVSAGAPMPTDDGVDTGFDLNRLLVRHPDSTWVFTVEGDSMNLAGIEADDKLIVDCKLEARHNDIVVAIVMGEGHSVKRFSTKGPRPMLLPESSNPIHKPRVLQEHDEWLIWGVVTGAVKQFR
jgi:DNA polymerase V